MEGRAILPGIDRELTFHLIWEAGEFDTVEKMEAEHERPYRALLEALIQGKIDTFDFHEAKSAGADGHLWRVMSRSLYPGVKVQASAIWVRDSGELVPLSHRDVNSFKDFQDLIPGRETEVGWMSETRQQD